jgi:hypothetical protein
MVGWNLADSRVLWKTPLVLSDEVFGHYPLDCEDLNGDGVREWVFLETPDEVVVVSHHGEKIASLHLHEPLQALVVVPQPTGYGLLITLQADRIHAYRCERPEPGRPI